MTIQPRPRAPALPHTRKRRRQPSRVIGGAAARDDRSPLRPKAAAMYPGRGPTERSPGPDRPHRSARHPLGGFGRFPAGRRVCERTVLRLCRVVNPRVFGPFRRPMLARARTCGARCATMGRNHACQGGRIGRVDTATATSGRAGTAPRPTEKPSRPASRARRPSLKGRVGTAPANPTRTCETQR